MPIAQRITRKDFPSEDQGLTVREALKLVEKSEFYDSLIDVFNIDDIKDEFIELPGAKSLVQSILSMESNFKKIDITSSLNDIRCNKFTDEGQAVLEVAHIDDTTLLKEFRTDLVNAETTYSVRSDYFNDLYQADKYLTFLHKKGYKDIIRRNLDMLEEKNKDEKKKIQLRLILDEERNLYARAITSAKVYKDYNIAFSVFVTLVQLHHLYKVEEESFEIKSFSLTESEIKVVFRNTHTYEFLDDSRISFALELSNDEIKRESVKLKGLFSIEFGKNQDVSLLPDEGTSSILSFTHSVNPSTVKKRLSDLSLKINDFIKDTISDFDFTKKIKKPDEIRSYLEFKTRFAREKEFTPYKGEILKLLSNRVSTLFQLLDLVDAVEKLFNDEDIKAQDFWKYKLYQALIEEPKK